MRRLAGILVLVFCALLLNAAQAGSWEQINQELQRPQGWQQIVKDSPFQLGEKTPLADAGGEGLYQFAFGTYPSIDGSTVAVPMAMEFARQHLRLLDSDLNGFVFFSTTHNAYVHLIQKEPNGPLMIASQAAAMDTKHPVDLILATEPSDEELKLAADSGVTLVKKPVCYDAFVFITHKDNYVSSLTVEQIQKIYSGKITNWKEVGGADAEIFAYQREKNSGSQTAMENLVMKGLPLSGAKPNYVTEGMGELIRRVGDYQNSKKSLGYTYKYYIDTLYKSEDIKILSVDGIAPSAQNLREGIYPFATSYFGVIRGGEESGTGGLFLDWMLSPEGQKCIAQAGYIPVTEVK